MYAVLMTGGKQYKVTENSLLRVEKLEHPVGDHIEFDSVKMVIMDDDNVVATPEALQSARVLAQVEGHGREKKIRVYKKKRRKGYERMNGHRQSYTLIRVNEIKM